MAIFDGIQPVTILLVLLAALWAALTSAIQPPRGRRFPVVLAGAVVGALVGQTLANVGGERFLMVGELHLLEVTIACLIAILAVRRLFA